jgi:non-ribosomal peptide synthetase component F
LARFCDQADEYPVENPVRINSPEDLVYVIYTSGTTGEPKGVMMQNKSIVNLLLYHIRTIEGNERTLQVANTGFDVSFQEIFSTLLSGACLYPISDIIKKDTRLLTDYIVANELTTVFLPTAYFRLLAETSEFLMQCGSSVKNFIVAGEQLILNDDTIRQVKDSDLKIHNHYGPAETHVVSSYVIGRLYQGGNVPPIGRPVSNMRMYILDHRMQPVAAGVPGKAVPVRGRSGQGLSP